MDNNIEKVSPYQRLQAILSSDKPSCDLKLTNKGMSILDDLLGKDEEIVTKWSKIKNFFLKIDSKIFSKQGKTSGRFQRR
jgi:hypothetical protein